MTKPIELPKDGWNIDLLPPVSTHSCGQCRTAYGISTIPCKNDPAVIAAAIRAMTKEGNDE